MSFEINSIENVESFQGISLSEKALADLRGSGLTDETIKRMGILPLTPDNFKKYLHFSLIEKATRQPIINDGYIIPYRNCNVVFGRCKVLEWNKASKYYQERRGDLPKYLQPSSSHIEDPLKLFFLEGVNLKSPKNTFFITEGEKKTAKLQQELDRLVGSHAFDDELEKLKNEGIVGERLVALGLGGVWNWNMNTFSNVPLKDKKVFLCFDADGIINPNVAKAEIRLFSYLISCGVFSVRSLVWEQSQGKGIDDLLVGKKGMESEVLLSLIENSVSPIYKYKTVLTLDSVLEQLAEYLFDLDDYLVEELHKAYRVGKRAIKSKFSKIKEKIIQQKEEKIKQEDKEKIKELYKNLFGIDFVPKFPDKFTFRDGLLFKGDESICECFVVSEIKNNINDIDGGYFVKLAFKRKTLWVGSEVLSSVKSLCRFLNRNNVQVSESEVRKIQDYIAKFIRINSKNITKGYFSSRTGWAFVDGEEIYVHPSISDVDVIISDDIERYLQSQGSLGAEKETVKRIIKSFPMAGLVYAMGVSVSILNPLLRDDYNLTVLLQGQSGCGKTSAIKFAVSFYANPMLKRTFNFTEGGFEHFVSKLMDFPIHLEEIRDLDRNPIRRFEKFLHFVYSFVGGVGKVRLNIDLQFRETKKYRGVVFTSSEIEVNEFLSEAPDNYREGLKRRLLLVPVDKEKLGGSELGRIVSSLYENYGNLLNLWIKHFNENKEQFVASVNERIEKFQKEYSIDTKLCRFLGVVSVVIDKLGEFLEVDTDMLHDSLREVAAFNEAVYEGEEVFTDTVFELLNEITREALVEQETASGLVVVKECKGDIFLYRRVVKQGDEIVPKETFLTAKGIDFLSKKMGMGRNQLVRKMKLMGILCRRVCRFVKQESAKIMLYKLNQGKLDSYLEKSATDL